MEKKEKNLEELKKEYEKIQKKYSLPSFEELNKEFWIEEIVGKETEMLIRHIGAKIGDSLFRISRFIESILNPANANMFTFSILKTIDQEDKKKLSEIYKELTKREIKYIRLDIEFSAEKEADFIKDVHAFWKKIKQDLDKILEKSNSKFDEKKDSDTKGYFG